jgi:hypothetical protein
VVESLTHKPGNTCTSLRQESQILCQRGRHTCETDANTKSCPDLVEVVGKDREQRYEE